MFSEEALYLHALNLLPAFGPARLCLLLNQFGSFKKAFLAGERELIQAGVDAEITKFFLQNRLSTNLEEETKKLEKAQINILTFKDPTYPKLLLEIPKFPPILYYRGVMPEPEELCVAVVGTRKISNYGRTVIPDLILPIVQMGVTIVSGMAFGVDSAAHQVAVDSKKRTIAVLGGGLDDASLYPKHHQLLAQTILGNGGALLSEYPIGTPSLKHHFISRNRIISGLSVATVIIECDIDSGSLITARHALEQNRTVYAVPGPIYSSVSQGPNNLLKMGAKPLTEANDILEDLNLKQLPQNKKAGEILGDTPQENAILKILSREPVNINELIKQSGLQTGEATSALTFLEMKGKVKNLGGQQYILAR